MTERLTTLTAVKEWLDITNDSQDSFFTRLIDAASQFVLGYLNRDSFQSRTYTQNFKGNGKDTMLMRNWPITEVTSVGVYGQLVGPSTLGVGGLPGQGYTVSDPRDAPQSINLYGYVYPYNLPCQVIYVAGFKISTDVVVPAVADGATYAVVTPVAGGCWSEDHGVLLDGVEALSVPADPAAGEYAVDQWGTYSFNEADVDKVATITYDYTPWSVSFATCELIGEWYKRKDRIGVLTKTLGGQETISFSQKDMNDSIRGSFQIYKNEIPV